MIRRARVTAAWIASYDPALTVERGETLTVGGLDPENPGWRWCVNAAGLGGWLPEGLVQNGRATADFSSRELTVSEGASLIVLEDCAGWRLCRAEDGRTGWVPDACLDLG